MTDINQPDIDDSVEENDGEDIGTLDLDGDGIPDDLDVGDLDDLVAATPTELEDKA